MRQGNRLSLLSHFSTLYSGDQLAIGKETGRRLGMGTNMYPSSTLLGQNKDIALVGIEIDELIEQADGFAGVFPGFHLFLPFSPIEILLIFSANIKFHSFALAFFLAIFLPVSNFLLLLSHFLLLIISF